MTLRIARARNKKRIDRAARLVAEQRIDAAYRRRLTNPNYVNSRARWIAHERVHRLDRVSINNCRELAAAAGRVLQ